MCSMGPASRIGELVLGGVQPLDDRPDVVHDRPGALLFKRVHELVTPRLPDRLPVNSRVVASSITAPDLPDG